MKQQCGECDLVFHVVWVRDGGDEPNGYCPRCSSEDIGPPGDDVEDDDDDLADDGVDEDDDDD